MSKKEWHLYILKDLDPIRVHTIYHALATSLSNMPDINCILLTTTNKSSMSCGFHQNFYEEVDINYCKKNDIQLVRRMSGGGLVLLEKNQVFFNVILNEMAFPVPIKKLYALALQGPNQYLKNLNLDSSINYNEIVIKNRKISGTGAASIEKAGVVIGNILLDFNHKKFCNALNVPSENFRSLILEQAKKYVTTLKRELPRQNISVDEVIDRLRFAFESVLNKKLRLKEFDDINLDKLNEVEEEYTQHYWNFRKRDAIDKTRVYIKIKNGAFIYHDTRLDADFLITNGRIKKVKSLYKNSEISKLVGMNIFKISKKFPEFKKLQEVMVTYCEHSNN
ncbi:MAG: lipoate--protein ligase family protein [Candidatus Lokiarchaeota archaeon]|nr:lipoate--protein ligase family protein [Candidatus Lokiarchaeota archaeon]